MKDADVRREWYQQGHFNGIMKGIILGAALVFIAQYLGKTFIPPEPANPPPRIWQA